MSGWIQIDSDKVPGHFIVKGFSGGPIWDDRIQAVVGMTINFETSKETPFPLKTAFFIPFGKIAQIMDTLWEDSYQSIIACWNNPSPQYFEEREHDAPSPLIYDWEAYRSRTPWHEKLKEQIESVTSIVELYPQLSKLTNQLKHQIAYSSTYEALKSKLKSVISDFEKNDLPVIDRMVAAEEKRLGVSYQNLSRKRSGFTDPEWKLNNLGSIPEKIIELKIDYLLRPQFNHCFLVLGEMGSGKSYFVNNLLKCSDENLSVLIFPNFTGTNLSAVICNHVAIASGINWPDLATIDSYLEQCEKATGEKHYFVIIFDDLSRFELLHHQFIQTLIDFIKANTHFHHFLWLFTAPFAFYPHLATYSQTGQSFWQRYGYMPDRDDIYKESSLEKWIVLDDLDRDDEVGIHLIQDFLRSTYPAPSDLSAQIDDLFDQDRKLKDILSNPLLAWIWLDYVQKSVDQNTGFKSDLRYTEFILDFWHKQVNSLIKLEQNNQLPKPFTRTI